MGEEDGRPDMINRDPNGLNTNLVVCHYIIKLKITVGNKTVRQKGNKAMFAILIAKV